MTIDMQNNLEADGAVLPPHKNDGSLYRYCMYFDNNRSIVFSDEPSELLARLIPGYKALDFHSQKDERLALINKVIENLNSPYSVLDFDLPEDSNSLGYASEESLLRSLHKLGFISLFAS